MAATGASPAPDKFIKDGSGRTLFYPFGDSWRGYAVPDAAREAALRAAVQRYGETRKRFNIWPFLLAAASFCGAWFVLDTHPFWFLGALVLPAASLVLCDRALLYYQIRDLVGGLERAGSRDKTPGYIRQIFLAGAALAWITQQLYQNRIEALPVAPGTTAYYADVAQPLVWTLLFGCVALVIAAARNKVPALFGGTKSLCTMLLFIVLQLCGVAYVAWYFLSPRPNVVVSADKLVCGWELRWADVTALSEGEGGDRRSSKQYASLKVGAAPTPSTWSAGDVKLCQISGLNEDYAAVYRDMRTAWLATRSGPDNRSGDARLGQIEIGATRQQVINVFGPPTLPGRTADGTVLMYYDFDLNDSTHPQPDRRVTAIYLGSDGRVERLARYGVQDGKIVDSVSGRNLTSGSEYLFLETILFDKPHRN
jgi:outer membrane protein assembly factor BamE (lipoprotein component of BamABCDE complex)